MVHTSLAIARLFSDLREVWPEADNTAFSEHLLASLKTIEDSPWGEDEKFNGRKLARFLRPFGVESRQVRVDYKTAKGYVFSELDSAFVRYLGADAKHGKQPA